METSFARLKVFENCVQALPELSEYKGLNAHLGCRTAFVRPACSSQKPHIERFHLELRHCAYPTDEVTLHPFLLGRKFQKAADKAMLKKNVAVTPGTSISNK